MGPSFSVELSESGLLYRHCEHGYEEWQTELIEVSDRRWKRFREKLDAIAIWEWQPEYANPGVQDGTHWHVIVAYDDVQIRSQGDNDYPGSASFFISADPANSTTNDNSFKQWLAAVRRLIGGRAFR